MALATREIKHQIALRRWSCIINECQQSGQFVEKWCEEHGIGVKSYYYWLKKVREEYINNLPKEEMEVISPEKPLLPVAIKPLEVEPPGHLSGNIVIHLPYGKVEVNGDMSKEKIRAAISALMEATC